MMSNETHGLVISKQTVNKGQRPESLQGVL